MFFVLSKTVDVFSEPLSLLFLALAMLMLCCKQRSIRWSLLGILVCLYGLSTSVATKPLGRWLEGTRPTLEALQPQYDVVIVLTGMVVLPLSTPDHIEFNTGVDRILAGIDLVKQGRADRLLISGGTGSLWKTEQREAQLLRTFVRQYGLQEEQVIIEPNARNTYENALYTTKILQATPYQRFLLVTSAMHMRRAAAAFYKQGLHPDLYPVDFRTGHNLSLTYVSFTPSVYKLATLTDMVHELVGLVAYRWQGYI